MSIDPRTLSQLLQLQIQSSVSLFPGSALSASGGEAGDFAVLLQALLEQTGTAASGDSAGRRLVPAEEALGAAFIGAAVPGPLRSLAAYAGLPAKPTTFEPLIRGAAERFGVEPALIKGVIQSESSFNPNAVSHAGAKGLMQLMDGTARSVGVTDSYDPEQNIYGGTKYLAALLRRYGNNEAVALAAYNAGPGTVDRLGIRTDADYYAKQHLLPGETRSYVPRVIAAMKSFAGVDPAVNP